MKRQRAITCLVSLATLTLALVGCRSESGLVAPTPSPSTGGNATVSTYPMTGHAPDYSWVAGRVTFTKIQGGCVYIYTDQAAIQQYEAALTPAPTNGTPGISGPFVGTAVRSDTSPPLRDITPQTGPQEQATPQPGAMFVPNGGTWDESKVKDGDYVVLFGRLAQQGDPTEVCPGGTAYIVDSWVMNP